MLGDVLNPLRGLLCVLEGLRAAVEGSKAWGFRFQSWSGQPPSTPATSISHRSTRSKGG